MDYARKMSLQNTISCRKNPFSRGDILKRDILWEFMNNEKKLEKIKEGNLLYRALRQFSWFHPLQQNVIYEKHLSVSKIREYTKYLKNKMNRS